MEAVVKKKHFGSFLRSRIAASLENVTEFAARVNVPYFTVCEYLRSATPSSNVKSLPRMNAIARGLKFESLPAMLNKFETTDARDYPQTKARNPVKAAAAVIARLSSEQHSALMAELEHEDRMRLMVAGIQVADQETKIALAPLLGEDALRAAIGLSPRLPATGLIAEIGVPIDDSVPRVRQRRKRPGRSRLD